VIQKRIVFFGKDCVLACDGKCRKAWGINGRPELFFIEEGASPRALRGGEEPPDWDDHVDVADGMLGDAPADPGTSEGGHGKPCADEMTDPARMNKWCARECERSVVVGVGEPIALPDMERPTPNMPKRRAA